MGERLSQADQDHRLKTMQAMNADLLKLRAEVEQLREALRRIAEKCEDDPRNQEPLEVARFARRVLGDTDHE
jgi:hypothetical protein